jgi:hypothetical protein
VTFTFLTHVAKIPRHMSKSLKGQKAHHLASDECDDIAFCNSHHLSLYLKGAGVARIYLSVRRMLGARGSAVAWGTALQTGRSRVRFPIMSLEFFIDVILPAVLGPSG